MNTISSEFKDKNIRCNTIIPGTIDTPANREWGSEEDIKNWVKPEDIADIIFDLISDKYKSVRESLIKIYGSY
jgi:NAD(P)-dependent dehydrogenase (short-subunit alcohol dehydrogenase family)